MQINNKKNSKLTVAVDFYQHFINILRANQSELRIKYTGSGIMQWINKQQINTNHNFKTEIELDDSGYVYIGTTDRPSGYVISVFRINSIGVLAEKLIYGGGSCYDGGGNGSFIDINYFFSSMTVDANNNLYIAGYEIFPCGNNSKYTLKVFGPGWLDSYQNSIANDIAVDNLGNVCIAGYYRPNDFSNYHDYLIRKYMQQPEKFSGLIRIMEPLIMKMKQHH